MTTDTAARSGEADIRAAYDGWHAQHTPAPDADAPWYRLIRGAVRPDVDLHGMRVLDVGCGLGSLTGWLATQPARPAAIVAADFSPVAVAKARERFAGDAGTPVEWAVADIQSLEGFGTEFDTVFSCETIEHVPDPPLAVRQLARVLKPGGRLYLTTPNYLGTMGLYRLYCRLRGKPFDEGGQPLCQLTLVTRTRAWVRRAGLRLIRTDGVGHYLPFPGRPPIRVGWLDGGRAVTRWVAHHTLFVAEKPAAGS
jgi:2-polyprenyl-3-methyl-5-hydroxy-6-metoxy-1,4-benzoquinol methylase